MTRQEIESALDNGTLFAECLRLYARPYMILRAYRELVFRIRATLATTNPQFDGAKFLAACEVEDD